MKCAEHIEGRRCRLNACSNGYCIHHQDQSEAAKISRQANITKKQAEKAINVISKTIEKTLAQQLRVIIVVQGILLGSTTGLILAILGVRI